MKVTVTIPDREWARLVDDAEARGLRVANIIEFAVRSILPPETKPIEVAVTELVRVGFPDARIAERLDVSRGWVAAIRRRAGLPANHFRSRSGGTNGRKSA